MRLRHIEVFHAVFVTGSVSAAARSLNVSQPTVSKVLKHAEDQLGFKLFHREKGRVYPTEKGDLLFKQTLPVFEQINDLRNYARMLQSTNMGRLRIAMTPAFSLRVVPKALAKFTQLYPEVPVEIETQHAAEVSKLVLNNTIDLGIVFEAVPQPGIQTQKIGLTEFVCVSPTPHNLKDQTLSLEQLADLPLIQLNSKSPLGQLLGNKLRNLDLSTSSSAIIAETYHLARRMVEQGAGVAVIDKITAYSGSKAGMNFHQLSDFDPIQVDIVTRSNDPLISYKKAFVSILEEALEEYR